MLSEKQYWPWSAETVGGSRFLNSGSRDRGTRIPNFPVQRIFGAIFSFFSFPLFFKLLIFESVMGCGLSKYSIVIDTADDVRRSQQVMVFLSQFGASVHIT